MRPTLIGFLLLLAGCALCAPNREYRPPGAGNNLANPDWGAAGIGFERYYIGAHYPGGGVDGIDWTRPNPRSISNLMRYTNGEGHRGSALNINQFHLYWSTFMLTDLSLTGIFWPWMPNAYFYWVDAVEADDWEKDVIHWGQSPNAPQTNVQLPVLVSVHTPDSGAGTNKPFTPINVYTAFLDLSMIYGNDEAEQARLMDKNTGYLITTLVESLPILTGRPKSTDEIWVDSGDIRVNKNAPVFALRQLFYNEHNRLVDELRNNNTGWDGMTLYQEARRINIAFYQNICVREYLAALVGQPLEPYVGYNDTLNPSIDLLFTHTAFRYGHTTIQAFLPLLDNDLNSCPFGGLLLRESIFRPSSWLVPNQTDPLGPMVHDHGSVFRGMSSSPNGVPGPQMVEDIRSFMFTGSGRDGFDLMSYDIVRGRESGLPDYNTARENMGLPRHTSFDQISSNPRYVRMLKQIYPDVDSIDLIVGGLCEDAVTGAEVGELYRKSFLDQFTRLRDGDRFWFENEDYFTVEEIEMIHGTKLIHLITRNFPDVANTSLPVSAFFLDQRQLFSSQGEILFPDPLPNYRNWSWTTKDLAPFYRLHWMIDRQNDPQTITIQLQVKTNGWVGIGFKPEQTNTMKGADIVLCRIPAETGVLICDDMKALDVGIPKYDVAELGGTDDIRNIQGGRDNGIFNVMFTRNLDVHDQWDNTISDDTRIIFAFNPITNDLRYHGPTRQSTTVINFLKDYKGPAVFVNFSQGVKIFLYVLAGIGIFTALVFLIMIAVSTEHFRFQTPEFCALICVGAIIGYISIILILPDQQTDKTCWASIWLFGMSFWIVFAGMFVKIGRVWWIVRALTKDFEQIEIPIWQLLVPISVCLLGETAFQICWDVLIPPNLETQMNKDDNTYFLYCAGNRFMWLGTTVVKAVFLGVGVYLALQTREFQKEINWSKELVLAIYTLAIVLIILIPLGFAIQDSAIMVVLLKGLGIFVAYFTVTFIMFFDSAKRIITGQDARTVVASNSVTRSSAQSRTQSGVSGV